MLQILDNMDIKHKHKKEIESEEKLFNDISINVQLKPAEILLMTLKYALLNYLSTEALINLLKLINIMFGTAVVPETKYFIDKLMDKLNNVEFHGVCPNCSKYLGTFESLKKSIICSVCNNDIDVSCLSNPCFFAFIDPSDAIKEYLEIHDNYYNYVVSERVHEKNVLRDIFDGKLYRYFVKSLSDEEKHSYATTLFNCDGAAVFKSTKFSIHPVYLIVNEIPVQFRLQSYIVCSLYFGSTKPDMSVYLDIFVEKMNRLSTVGLQCMIQGSPRTIKVFPLLGCVDTIARAPMTGSSQFNGYFGCDWCLQEGKYYGGSIRYPYVVPFPKERTLEMTIKHAEEATRLGKSIYGIKSASPLLNLKKFDIIRGFCPEYMHFLLLGIGKQFTEYILLQSSVVIEYLDSLVVSIKAAHVVGRLSRPISQRDKWKAKEWENWILYYSVPIFSLVITDKTILRHWCLLVDASHTILQTDITFNQLNKANEFLYEFVSKVEELYSLNAMTYNVHQLLHVIRSIIDWGPIWAHSAFAFESANHKTVSAIKCGHGVLQQIIRFLSLQRYVEILTKKVYAGESGISLYFCEYVLKSKLIKTNKISNVTYLGRGNKIDKSLSVMFSLPVNSVSYTKIIFQNCLFTTSIKINKRSCNYCAQLKNGMFIKIMEFVVTENKRELMICCNLIVRSHSDCESVFEQLGEQVKSCYKISEIKTICICVFVEKKTYLIPAPNMYSY